MNSKKTLQATLAALAALGLAAAPGFAQVMEPGTAPTPAPIAAGTGLPDITAHAYVLAPTDQLDISVQGHEELHQSVSILTDGTFQFPIAGKVHASGKTVDQLEKSLAKSLSDICRDPQVTVLVRESHTRRISVLGSAKAPGQYEFRPGLRLLELMAQIGGPASTPELTSATLFTDGGTKSTPIDLVKLMVDGDTSQNVALAPGDTLLFSPRDPALSMVQVVGEVQKPGQYDVLTGGATVLFLLTQAGGAAPQAALTHAQLMHAGNVQSLDLHALKYDLDAPVGKIKLVAGDTLLIPENKQKIAVFGEVRAPSVYLIPDGENLPITQALAEAGGPTNDGDKKQVGVLRLGPDHTRHLIAYNMDALLKGDGKVQDDNLQPGDILVVPTRHRKQGLGEYVNQLPGIYTLTHLFTGF